jgi:hypothetical protein
MYFHANQFHYVHIEVHKFKMSPIEQFQFCAKKCGHKSHIYVVEKWTMLFQNWSTLPCICLGVE